MSDRFTEVTRTGYGGRIVQSLWGVIIGLILFIVSFGVLYWNEGRVDLSTIAKTAVEISGQIQNTDSSLDGKLVSVSGVVNSDQIIGDGLLLKPDRYMVVERKVEMYAWIERKETKSKREVGGGETRETTYSYVKEWVEHPESSANFRYPEEHENPQKALDSYSTKVTAATIGVYNFSPQSTALPDASKLSLNSQNVILSEEVVLANDTYLFMRKSEGGTFENPQVGDLRISFNILRPGFEGTIFGKLSGDRIDPYFDKDGNRLYRVFTGTREEGIATLHSEYKTRLWLLRLVGFLLMWFGLMALFGPISVLLDILPIFGTISRVLIGTITFLVALVLSVVTILVSMLLHSLVASIVALIIVAGVIFYYFVYLKKKKAAATVSTAGPPPGQV